MTLLLIVAILLLFAAVYIVIEVASIPDRQRRESIVRATAYGGPVTDFQQEAMPGLRERVFKPLVENAAALVLKVSPKTNVQLIEKRLLVAGIRHGLSAPGFLALKAFLTLAGFILGVLAGSASGSAFRAIVFGLGLGALGYIIPDRVLVSKGKNRREQIQIDLPDALDLMAISVEAGLGLDGAIAQIVENMKGPLSEELALTLGGMRVGESRQDALKNLADRVDVPEMTSLVRAIIQSDQLGMPLGRILRLQAKDARIRRQNAAEEKANKAPIKMVFPTVLFIFPALFFVVLGPAFITIFKVL